MEIRPRRTASVTDMVPSSAATETRLRITARPGVTFTGGTRDWKPATASASAGNEPDRRRRMRAAHSRHEGIPSRERPHSNWPLRYGWTLAP